MAKKSELPHDWETMATSPATIKRLAQGMRANLAANGLSSSQVKVNVRDDVLSYTDCPMIDVEIMAPGIERARVAPLLAVPGARYASILGPMLAYDLVAKKMAEIAEWVRESINDPDQDPYIPVPLRYYPYSDRILRISRGAAHDIPCPVVLRIDGKQVLESCADYIAKEIAIMAVEHR
jgi:hypothetical protein